MISSPAAHSKGMPVFSGDSGRISLAFAAALEIIALPTLGHRVMPGVLSSGIPNRKDGLL